jgi:hypothetical protein
MKTSRIIGYSLLILAGILFLLVMAASFGNALAWLAINAAVGLIGAPVYALVTKRRILQLPLWARCIFWYSSAAALVFVALMIFIVLALRNNFS